MDTQLQLFDISAIPRRNKARCYLRGYHPAFEHDLHSWYIYLEKEKYPYYVALLSPTLLRPTQRTIDPKTVLYYRLTGREKDGSGFYPTVIYAHDAYWIMNGHHRITAALDKPRIRVRVYDMQLPLAT